MKIKAKAKTGSPIIVFRGDVTPIALTYMIPKDFCGDIVVHGSIHSKSENPKAFENLNVNLNDGDLYVLGDIYNLANIDIGGNLYCYGTIRPTPVITYEDRIERKITELRVNGDVFVANDLVLPLNTTISGNFTSASKVIDKGNGWFSVLGNFEANEFIADAIESYVKICGYTCISNGFRIE